MNIIRKIYSPLILSILVFLLVQLVIFNLGIGFRDEGFLNLAADRIISGNIPYRDFFLTTTPGTYYILSAAYLLLGKSLIVSRIIYILFVLGILYIVDKVYELKTLNKVVALVSISILFWGRGALGFYNVEALFFILLTFYFLILGLDSKSPRLVFVSGLLIAVSALFKQSYGTWVGLGFLVLILLENVKNKFKYITFFIGGGVLVGTLYGFYLYITQSINQFIYYTIVFAKAAKSHRDAFIFKSILSVPILLLISRLLTSSSGKFLLYKYRMFLVILIFVGLSFAVFKYSPIFEASRIYYAFFLIFPTFLIAATYSNNKARNIRRSAILLLTLFLANASSGRE